MSKDSLVSIIISSYNYGPFLQEAIDSALNQTYPHTEVIVIDDGSTDNSPEIIVGYGNRIISLLKENEGPVSTWNKGFKLSRGEVICFLDSDDVLLPTAVEEAVKFFDDPGVAKVHWPLWVIDKHGRKTGRVSPPHNLPEGNLRDVVIRDGPASYVSPPTTGNAWSRRFLKEIFPVPAEFRRDSDAYLIALAPIFGTIKRISEPQGYYRVHGDSDYTSMPAHDKSRRNFEIYNHRCSALSRYLREIGINIDPEVWKQGNAYYEWFARLHTATDELKRLIPPGETFILVDQDQWGGKVFADRHNLPFLERAGQYWGPPPDDETAISELVRLRQLGANYMVFAWPAFWWLEHYAGLQRHLRAQSRCLLENDRLIVFDLRAKV